MKGYLIIICCFLLSLSLKSQTVEEIFAKDAFEIISERDTSNTALIDGRSAAMFSEEHIEGAININAFEDSLSTKLKNYLEIKQIIVYCSNYRRSEIIIETLKELKYTGKIIFISDGINGWISSGFKTVKT